MQLSRMRLTTKNILFPSVLIGVYLLGWYIQSQLLFNWDVSWLTHVARRLLAGGSYTKDFFELNPPMILYLYIPIVLLTKYTSLSVMIALRIYIYFLASISLLICYWLAKKIFSAANKNTAPVVTIALAVSYIILPIYEFGQRENLMLMFVMPYFLLVANRLEKISINPVFALLIGIIAGIGFAIKPHFVMTFLLIEVYRVVKTRRLLAWINTEAITIMSILCIYLVSIYLFHRDYLTTVVPLAMRTYYNGIAMPWYMLAQHIVIPFSCLTIAFYFTNYQKNPFKIFSNILLMALIGFCIAYFSQHTYWHYHILPLFSISVILAALLFNNLIEQKELPIYKLLSFGLFLFIIPVLYSYILFVIAIEFKESAQKLIAFMQEHAKDKSIYLFSSTTVYLFPEIDYSNATPASRSEALGWIRAIVKQQGPKAKEDTQYFVNMIAEDFNTKKPDYVFVDVQKNKSYIEDVNFDYLKFFSHYPKFTQAWKSYRYLATIDNEPKYKFEIYQRVH